MPEVVQAYVDTHDIAKVVTKQNEILEFYRLDIAKYAEDSDKPKIRVIFEAIPSKLNDKTRCFFLDRVDPNCPQLRYANSFEWLTQAGVALPWDNVTAPSHPCSLTKSTAFSSCSRGCGTALRGWYGERAILQGDLSINMGSILENVMAQRLRCNGLNLHFFDTEKYGESDFVVQNGLHVELIEVKTGKDYKKYPSLDKVLTVEEWKTEKAYVLCPGNVDAEDGGDLSPLVHGDVPQTSATAKGNEV